MENCPRLLRNIVVGVFKMLWIFGPFEVDVEGTLVTEVTVSPVLTVATLFESSCRAAEIVFRRFSSVSSRGFSKRPRSKDMVMDRIPVVVCSLTVKVYVVKL